MPAVKLLARAGEPRPGRVRRAGRRSAGGAGRGDALVVVGAGGDLRGRRDQGGRAGLALRAARASTAADVVAFGDMPNDMPMLGWAGRGGGGGQRPPRRPRGRRRGDAGERRGRRGGVPGEGLPDGLRSEVLAGAVPSPPPGWRCPACRGPSRRGRPGSACRPPRICSSCTRAAICWATRAAWMPWNRPSSQPTSWACAIRSSASLGGVSSPNGSESRSSSSRSSGARPSSSSAIDRWWISRSRLRLASSSGAARTSSSSCLIMLPIRMTLAGCSIRLAGSSPWRRRRSATVPIGRPSGPTTTTVPERPGRRGRARRLCPAERCFGHAVHLTQRSAAMPPGPTPGGRTTRAGRASVTPCLSTRAPC